MNSELKRLLVGLCISLPMTLPATAQAEIVDPAPENLIFSYDVDPGTLSGVEAYSGNYLGSVDAYDYRQSTTSLWVNIDDLVDDWGGMLQVGNDHNERRPGIWLRPSESKIYTAVKTDPYISDQLRSEIDLTLDTWINITMVMDSGSARLYYDGSLVSEVELVVNWPQVFDPTWEVHTARLTSGSVDGRIDDVRIYDRALDETEIEQMMYNSRYVDVPVPYMISALGLFFAVRNRRKC